MKFFDMHIGGLTAAQILLLGGVVVGFAVLFFFKKPAGDQRQEFDWSRLKGDVDRREYVEDRLDERLSKIQSPDQFGTDIMLEQKGKFVILITLQLISAGITFWFWNKAGDGFSAKVMAGAFGLFNLVVLPYALGKAGRSMIAALMSFGIILLSFLASSGLASMTTSGKERASRTADADRARYEEQIKKREGTLLNIDQSVSRESLLGKKAKIEAEKQAVLATQVRYTAKARRRKRGAGGGTLDDLSKGCTAPWPVRRAGVLCSRVGELKTQISAVQRRIDALASANRLRSEIAQLTAKRDQKSAQTISDPLAPIRAVLPENISAALGDLRSVLIGFVGEIIFNGFAYLFMSDVNEEAVRRWKSARRKAFRDLVVGAGDGGENNNNNNQDGDVEMMAAEAHVSPVPEVETVQVGELLPVVKKLAVKDELYRLQKLVAIEGPGEPAVYFDQAVLAQPGNELGSLAVYEDYQIWCDDQGYSVMDYVDFAKGLAALMVGRFGSGSIDVDVSTMGYGQQVNYRGIALRRSLRLVAAG